MMEEGLAATQGPTSSDKKLTREQTLYMALRDAVATIEDYLAYTHDGDPWKEDARTMGEMDINDYAADGRLRRAKELLEND
jgi:hypothetical protein